MYMSKTDMIDLVYSPFTIEPIDHNCYELIGYIAEKAASFHGYNTEWHSGLMRYSVSFGLCANDVSLQLMDHDIPSIKSCSIFVMYANRSSSEQLKQMRAMIEFIIEQLTEYPQ